mmetsp:Transcript_22932/g.35335  ORF Transcript_22932/g.35335 Transcript_22932/m.35335 type:complete len:80 (+) Transcript_22932:1053-1292(+)
MKGDFDGTLLFKVVFRNTIGKTLFTGNVSGAGSKIKVVENKTHKNQIKVLVFVTDEATKKMAVNHCTINFGRKEDMMKF